MDQSLGNMTGEVLSKTEEFVTRFSTGIRLLAYWTGFFILLAGAAMFTGVLGGRDMLSDSPEETLGVFVLYVESASMWVIIGALMLIVANLLTIHASLRRLEELIRPSAR